MSRYIDADALKANCDITVGDTTIGRRDYVMFHEIDSAPSIDIVRCGECKYDGTWKCPWRNTQVPRYPSANDFCSYGERKDDE